MNKESTMTQKTKPTKKKRGFIVSIISIIVFFISIIGFMVDARLYTKNANQQGYIIAAYILIVFISISLICAIIGIILAIIDNKERIKAYYKEIENGKGDK